jgi:hypothetical protein
MRTTLSLVVLGLSALLLLGEEPKKISLPPPAEKQVDFDADVKPLFATHCFKCHAGDKQKGGFRLDDEKAFREGGNSGVVARVGKSAESLLIHLVSGTKPDEIMPPGEAKKLTPQEIGILRAWIDQGAKWGKVSVAHKDAAKSNHWAFQPPKRASLPKLNDPWVANPIDAFILARLQKEGLRPSVLTDRHTLIRRMSFDLLGLPPTPEEVNAFVEDTSPDAIEKLIDRLLASPHYGERWARHWLDLARYADSDGYEKDTGRPFAWRFREWVIQALNRDLPFDQFTVEQLAGDLLPNSSIEQKTATGFHRNTLTNKEGGADQEEFRVAAVVDRVNTTGTVWLGLTVGCCQCHDHKYDPLSQREYYQFFAYFNTDRELDLSAPTPGELDRLKIEQQAFDARTKELAQAVEEGKKQNLKDAQLKQREKALTDHQKAKPTPSKVQTISQGPARATHIHIRGDFLRKGVEVVANTPAVLPKSVGTTRLDLARWLVARDNPLTPRVTVNWVWGKLFGRGLVATPEDFGTQGQKPSHPELLDDLAVHFRDDLNWSLKKLHKTILMSATYRQASTVRTDLIEKDPLNLLLARQNRLRLEAEIVRDNALSVSGLLTRSIGGPSIRPPQPSGISELTYANSAKWVTSTGADRFKRGLYIWFQRTSPYPTLITFDSTDSNVCVVRRERSNTPLQALTMLNDTVFVETAQALARRVQADRPEAERGEYLFTLCFGRSPSSLEKEKLKLLLEQARNLARSKPEEAIKLLGSYRPKGLNPKQPDSVSESVSWVIAARSLLNLDEFVTRE